jgi:NAD(P)-dependent dehydrogenase (short-subunit alcohol dehydrogenase family)
MGSLTHASDPTSRHYGPYASEYRASKAALNMLVVQYAGRLGREGVKVLGADPAFCATGLAGEPEALRKLGATEEEVGGGLLRLLLRAREMLMWGGFVVLVEFVHGR